MSLDLAAEKALSLTLVLNPQAWDYVGPTLRPDMFGSEQARAVFEAVAQVVASGKKITPVTVQASMLAAGKGTSAVPGWATGKPVTPEEAQTLAARVRDLWASRHLAAEAATVTEDTPPADAAKRLAAALDAVQRGADGKARSMLTVVYEWFLELEEDSKHPERRVFYDTGFKALDEATGGLARGELSVFAARPGNGKSSFVMALATNLALVGVKVGLFWLEDDCRDAARRFIARRFQAEAWRLRGRPDLAFKYATGIEGLVTKADLPIYVDDTHGLTITDLCARMRRMRREYGVEVFVLDHLGEVRIEREERWGDRHDLALGRVAREYRDTAKSLGCVPVLVSQMNRRWEQRGTDAIPQMSDLDGSGQVEQAARLIAFVQMHRGDDGVPTGKGTLHVAKATGGRTGAVGLKWNGGSMTWESE
jgi:replicative DNA helicase